MRQHRKQMIIAVGIATSGRREILSRTLDLVAKQSRLPDRLIVCPATSEDVDLATVEGFAFCSIVPAGERGLTAQRNRILSAVGDADIVVFFDDDFFPQANYLAEVEKIFVQNSDVVAATGRPLQDGANGPGFSVDHALAVVRDADLKGPSILTIAPTYGTYGCNMAFRMGPIRQHALLFDEKSAALRLAGGYRFLAAAFTFRAHRGIDGPARSSLGCKGRPYIGSSVRLFTDREPRLFDAEGNDVGGFCDPSYEGKLGCQPGKKHLAGTLDRPQGEAGWKSSSADGSCPAPSFAPASSWPRLTIDLDEHV